MADQIPTTNVTADPVTQASVTAQVATETTNRMGMCSTLRSDLETEIATEASARTAADTAFANALNGTSFGRTSTPISVSLGAISVLGAGILPSVSVTVPGVSAGDYVLASFNGTAPANITLSGVQATAANTVRVTPTATAALVLGASNLSLNFLWIH